MTALEYERTDGTESFHGSGLVNCYIDNNRTDEGVYGGYPAVKIGANCLVYNAPMTASFMRGDGVTPIIQNDGYLYCNFFGDITVEKSTSSTPLVSPNAVYILGNIVTLGQSLTTTNAILCDRFQVNSDGSHNAQRKRYAEAVSLGEGGGELFTLKTGSNGSNNTRLSVVRLSYSYYEYEYLILTHIYAGQTGGTVTVLQTLREFNQAGFGAPTFTYNSRTVSVSNTNYPDGVKAYITHTDLSDRTEFLMI